MRAMTAADVLRMHVVERHLRRGIRSVALDRDDVTAVPRLSHDAWVDSLLLVRGVPEYALELLEHFHTGHTGGHGSEAVWAWVLVDVQGNEEPVRVEQLCRRLSIREAAERAGLGLLTHKAARAIQMAAIQQVMDNQLARAGRGECAA
jgi:hypothetical protein